MPRVSEKREKINKAKLGAPKVPGITCPSIDYVQEFGGSYLKVINPNATAQCGCGESFAVQSKTL